MGAAKLELRELYPKVVKVCFLNSRKKAEKEGKLKGWLNFHNPTDCRETYNEMLEHPQKGIVVEEFGTCQEAPLLSSLQPKKPNILKKIPTKFDKDLKFDKSIKPL